MKERILVCYASRSGSTGEVAEAVAEVLAERGAITTVVDVDAVQTLSGYTAVVVGSSIRAGRWLPEASDFVLKFSVDLAQKKVAYFTTCLTMLNDETEGRKRVVAYMQPVLAINGDIRPVGLGLFCGSLNPALAPIMPNHVYGDHRNWEAIKEWAGEIAPQLIISAGAPAAPVDLKGMVLSYTDLAFSDLHHVNLSDAKLDHADLSEVDLHGARLNWATLDDSRLVGANLQKANLIGAKLDNSDLTGADLNGAVLNGASLMGAKLTDCDLRDTDLNWADLANADLRGCRLGGATLGWANLDGADLDGADLTGAYFNAYTIWPPNFSPAAAGCVSMGDAPY